MLKQSIRIKQTSDLVPVSRLKDTAINKIMKNIFLNSKKVFRGGRRIIEVYPMLLFIFILSTSSFKTVISVNINAECCFW